MAAEYCVKCRGQGIVWGLPNQGEAQLVAGPYAFRCSCAWGQNDFRNYPRWNSYYAKYFNIDHKAGDPDPKPLEMKPSKVKPYHPVYEQSPSRFDDSDDIF